MVMGVIEIEPEGSIAEKACAEPCSLHNGKCLKLEASKSFPTYVPSALSDESENRSERTVTTALQASPKVSWVLLQLSDRPREQSERPGW